MSQKAARGTKRTCQGCGARFYDLDNKPVVCPMCEAEFKLAPSDNKDDEVEVEVEPKPVATPATPAADTPSDGEEANETDELADIETADVDVAEDDNTFIEDDEDPNASVAAIVPAKSDGEES